MEQKNFDAVRKLVGYARYTTPETLRIMNELYHKQGLLQNYVYPCFKLEKKVRLGSRYSKNLQSAYNAQHSVFWSVQMRV